jgi:hypothetical protein
MNNKMLDSDKIISRLEVFNYNYDLDGATLKIFLPMFCYLKVKYNSNKIAITSHISFGFRFLPIEINFALYGFALYILTWFQWTNWNKGIFALLGIFLIYFVVCFIKLESMRSILHSWIEKDRLS